MLIRASTDIWLAKGSVFLPVLEFIGDPVFALLVAALLATVTFGTTAGFAASTQQKKFVAILLTIADMTFIVRDGDKQVHVDGGAGPPSHRSPSQPAFRSCCSVASSRY